MFEVSEIIFSILNNDTKLTNLGIEVQPIISDQESNYPLVNYTVSEDASLTKDKMYPYNIGIRVYATTYKQSLQIIDAVFEAFKNATQKFNYQGTQEPQVDVFNQVYTQSNYKFKK